MKERKISRQDYLSDSVITPKNVYYLFPELQRPLFFGDNPSAIAEGIISEIANNQGKLNFVQYSTKAVPDDDSQFEEEIFLSNELDVVKTRILRAIFEKTGFKKGDRTPMQRKTKDGETVNFKVTKFTRTSLKQVDNSI